MSDRPPRRRALGPAIGCLTVLLALGPFAADLPAAKVKAGATLRFAADMAKRGNWREARYRWNLVASEQADNPRLLNNLAVASEALGEPEVARDYYEKALAAAGDDERINDNHRRFMRGRRAQQDDEEGDAERVALRAEVDGSGGDRPTAADDSGKRGSKAFRVAVGLPVPPRLELEGTESILVTSFVSDDTMLLDVNRELVRFLRSEFRKRTELDVLDVVPPPAIPEQSVEDLLRNREFWKYLSREYDADLIVSGVVMYDREDASSFQNVDMVDSRTGHKVRQGVFVEQERFSYELELFFIEGPTGTLLFRDVVRRTILFRGAQNDPITAFYEMSESIAGDVLAVVSPRVRQDTRVIFRN